MLDHPSSRLQSLTHLKFPLVTTSDLSNHLSHTSETSVRWPLPQSRFVLSCSGDKRSFPVFTSGLCKVNDKSVHRGLRVSQSKRPPEPSLTSQSNSQWLLKNPSRLSFFSFLPLFLRASVFHHQLSKKYCSFVLLSCLSLWQHSQAVVISSFFFPGLVRFFPGKGF